MPLKGFQGVMWETITLDGEEWYVGICHNNKKIFTGALSEKGTYYIRPTKQGMVQVYEDDWQRTIEVRSNRFSPT